MELNVIHIGKCGGSSIRKAIASSDIVKSKYSKVSITHVSKVKYFEEIDYLIIIRNPISRLLSAFNWRYYLIVESEIKKNKSSKTLHEWEILNKYNSLDNLAKILYDANSGNLNKEVAEDFNLIGHFEKNISYYLEDSLKFLKPNQVFGVIKQESIEKDCERILGVKLNSHERKNQFRVPPYKLHLSSSSIKNLKKFISNDYLALRKLYDLNVLNKEELELLERDPST